MMCLDCNCGKPNDNHGDARHITMQTLQQAAQASGVSTDEVARRIQQGARQGGASQGGSGQSMAR